MGMFKPFIHFKVRSTQWLFGASINLIAASGPWHQNDNEWMLPLSVKSYAKHYYEQKAHESFICCYCETLICVTICCRDMSACDTVFCLDSPVVWILPIWLEHCILFSYICIISVFIYLVVLKIKNSWSIIPYSCYFMKRFVIKYCPNKPSLQGELHNEHKAVLMSHSCVSITYWIYEVGTSFGMSSDLVRLQHISQYLKVRIAYILDLSC